ncbi:carboxymuconolactone decarboxylase family protein [Streptomyces roseirectus]|uniref:Carboxymuconolactone decarboxylase family protein n=1 Tax=Streptomyces roseirectus TaxID=2768066 RepID=A0A7H0ITN8_9ACTN|nr:carboxymuconolactone decarboxylase family protein [Streptomyces roseirectus]
MRARRGGHLTPLDETLLHSPPVADGWNTLLGAIRTQTLLDADIRELAILRVAALNGAAYEWDAHQPVALRAGLSRHQTDALRGAAEDAAPLLTPAQRCALAYTDAMTRAVDVPDEVFDRLRSHFDDRRIVELTAVIATYNLVSRFLVALHVGSPGGPADENGAQA